MKNLYKFILIAVVIILLSGCAKLLAVTYEDVSVKVVDARHQSAWIQPVRTGKVTTYVPHPEQHIIYVEYNGVNYSINDSTTYHKYVDQVGNTVVGTLEARSFDDGSVRYKIVSLK